MAKRKTAGRRTVRKAAAKRGARKTRRAAQKRSAAKKSARKAAKPTSSAKAARKGAASARRRAATARKGAASARKGAAVARKRAARKMAAKKAPPRTAGKKSSAPRAATTTARRAPTLDRQRRTVAEAEVIPSPPSSLDLDRSASAARTGRAELNERLQKHTSTGPALTGGDIDADWEDAETVGDEAPGGDNPTPDQDVVDEIGKALGVEYDDDEELQGGDEIVERDRNRWELDPASREDFEDE